MDGVIGRGTVLSGRYELTDPRPCALPGTSEWTATDQILARPVVVRTIPAGGAGPALDAARRASLVADPRLVRVLDVGSDDGVGYVVTELVAGPTLDRLVAREPLSADQARAIVGEAATALEVARRRGVHHLALRPSTLAVSDEGRVLVSGLALDAVLLGRAGGDARTTSRVDATDLVRLVYAALTGHWPGPAEAADGLPTAPETDGVPVPPAELVPGVPADLNTLCVATLGREDDGPLSPADLVRELEPWGEIRVQGRARPHFPPVVADPAPPVTAPGQVVRQSVRSAFTAPPSGAHRAQTPPAPSGRDAVTPPMGVPSAFPVAAGPGEAYPAPGEAFPGAGEAFPAPGEAFPGAGEAFPVPGAAFPGAEVGEAYPGAAGGAPEHPAPAHPAPAYPGPAYPGPAYPGPAVPTGAATSSPPPAAFPAPAPTAPMPPLVPPQAGPGAPPPRFEPPAAGDPDPFDFGRLDEPAPRRAGMGIAVAIVAVLVVLAIAFAAKALFSGHTATLDTGAAHGGTGQHSPTSAATSPHASPSPTPTPSATAVGGTAVISGLTVINPDGSPGDHPELLSRAFDGDPSTYWMSMTYARASFGGLKPALGLQVQLAQPATVHTVTLHVNGTGGNVEIRTGDATQPTGGTLLASGPMSPDAVFTLDPAQTTSSLVIWFTQLPTTSDGAFRIELTEIQLG